jgi:hypothetical protein
MDVSVLLVCSETTIDFSRYIPIIRGDLMDRNSEECERNALTGATLEPRDVNNTVCIACSRAL